MSVVASRELRNDTSGLLRRVQDGEEIVITVNQQPVARLLPLPSPRRRWLGRGELAHRLRTMQADRGLRDDLNRLAGETTDELTPIR